MRELLANSASNNWYFRRTRMRSLEAKLNGLPGLNTVVPAHSCCGIRVSSGHGCIPGAGYAGGARVAPIHIPTVDSRSAAVSDTHRAGKARTPVIGDQVTAVATNRRRAGCDARYRTAARAAGQRLTARRCTDRHR